MERVTWLVRHGEATHNVDFTNRGARAYMDPQHCDSLLTTVGETQARQCTLPYEVELVVVSPLRRALQTANLVKIASSIPVVVLDCVREFPIGHTPNIICGAYHPTSFDFSQMKPLYKNWEDGRLETISEVDERVLIFCEWLANRSERNIAVISHNSFLNRFMTNTCVARIDAKELSHACPIRWIPIL